MSNRDFYNSPFYQKRQAIITKANWEKGIYDFKYKREKRECAREGCNNIFEVQKSDKKKFCSHNCSAVVNNLKHSNISSIRKEVEKLYRKGLSMTEIAERTGWEYGKIVYCMKKFAISRRNISEAIYQKLNPNGDPFKIKKNLSSDERELLGLGIGLFWGEGNKASKHAVRLGNSDPKLIRSFREFLIKICGIKKDKLRYSLLLFNDANESNAINFWNKKLGLVSGQISSVTSLKPRGKGTYKKKSMTGVLVIEFCNVKLKKEIDKMVEIL